MGRPSTAAAEWDGWIFVDGSAYVAADSAFGGYAADLTQSRFRVPDQRSPVVIEAFRLRFDWMLERSRRRLECVAAATAWLAAERGNPGTVHAH